MITNNLENLEAGFINLDKDERLVFSFSKYYQLLRLDIRHFFLAPEGRWYPSTKGISIWQDNWALLLPILKKIYKEIKIYLKEKENDKIPKK